MKSIKLAVCFLTLALPVTGCSTTDSSQARQEMTPNEVKAIAKEAFFWSFHQVAFYHFRYFNAQMEKSPVYAGMSRMNWNRKPITADYRAVTTPNATTMYGFGCFDLSTNPVVIDVPAIKDRYWSIQACDQYSSWFAFIGKQFSGTDAQKLLILGPDWKSDLPKGFKGTEIVRSRSNLALIAGRLAVKTQSKEEITRINQLMDSITVVPLAMWEAQGRKPIPASKQPKVAAEYQTIPNMHTVRNPAKMPADMYYQWVSLVINDSAMTKRRDSHKEILALREFAKICLKEGAMFDINALSSAHQQAVRDGYQEAVEEANDAFRTMQITRGGWSYSTALAYSENNWVLRAGNGMQAIGAPIPYQSHTAALGFSDSKDRPLDAAHAYTLTFDMDNLPPVTEFWSIPMYDNDGYFVHNPIDRYTVNSFMLDDGDFHIQDGKLVFYLQNTQPSDPNKAKNWLPTPAQGAFRMAARFYGPYSSLQDGSYKMPRPVRVQERY